MPTYEAGTVTKNGQEIPISVDEDGKWLARVGNDRLSKDTRSSLVSAIDRLTKRAAAEVAVPFVVADGSGSTVKFRHGVAYGIHSGSGNLLVVWKSGAKEQYRGTGYSSEVFAGETSDDELVEYRDLVQAQRDATAALREFVKAHQFDVKRAVEAELTKAAEAAGA